MKKLTLAFVAFLFMVSLAATIDLDASEQTETLVDVSVTSYFDSDNTVENVVNDVTYGTKVSFENNLASEDTEGNSDYAFAYWIYNGSIRKDLPVDHTFTVTENIELIGVFSPTDPMEHAAVFMDANEAMIDIQYVPDGGDATAPDTDTLPDKPGYTPLSNEESESSDWDKSLTGLNDNTVFILQYAKTTSDTHTVSVSDGTTDDGSGASAQGTYDFNTVATVEADAPDSGEYFHHWEIEDSIVSYDSTFDFTVFDDTEIHAVYSDSEPTEKPHVRMSNTLSLRDGHKSYIGQFYLPDDYELIEYGMMTSTDTQKLSVNSESATRREATKYSGQTNEFVMSFEDTDVSSVEPYLVVKNPSGDLETVYATPAYNLWNGGFETGTMEGWNEYQIWKNEDGMRAFVDDLIVDGTYFDNYSYNRDGTYNKGVVGGSVEWNQAEERMGHLRSADFTLAGSGWVSFKLGGGNTDSFAYVSVRKASDDTEVARFGNRHYNDTSVSETDNAEAYMFPYYYDLSSLDDVSLGDELYFVLSDTSSFNWSILSADSFETYHPTAPTPSEDEEAVNILPDIPNVDTASNDIPNGNFDNDLDDWDNSDGIYRIDGGKALSNEGGDDALGVLRSSAFTIDGTNKYLRFGWGGAISEDKQLFLSIKEVGTNIEVMRVVRRDNLSDKVNGDLDNHMVDLTGLDTSKAYYLEFGDNLTGSETSWACNVIDDIRLVDETEWDSVIDPHPGDEAVYISGLTTNYTYRLPD